jgi:hypothetical protein
MSYQHSFPIVDATARTTPAFQKWMAGVDLGTPILGIGSPEGVQDAPQFSLYIDKTGTTGSILFIKMQPSIAGDTKQGWILV